MTKRPEQPKSNFDVTEASGYTFEAKVTSRNSNGWGGTQTRLPEGHLARRDSPATVTKRPQGGEE